MLNITVKVEKVLERQSFTSKRDGATVNRYSFVAVTTAEQYPKTICFSCLGDDTWAKLDIVEGGTYDVSFDITSREWNGKYFTDINAFRAQRIDTDAAASVPPSLNHTGGTDFRRNNNTAATKKSATAPPPSVTTDETSNPDSLPF